MGSLTREQVWDLFMHYLYTYRYSEDKNSLHHFGKCEMGGMLDDIYGKRKSGE